MTTITRRYHFESAHWLPGVPDTHRCKNLHGHNYEMEVTVEGSIDPKTGFIIDFWDLDDIVQPIIKQVDHKLLNDIMPNPTAELIANWFLDRISTKVIRVIGVRIYETKDCWADVKV